jgi:hypothetical protein
VEDFKIEGLQKEESSSCEEYHDLQHEQWPMEREEEKKAL